MPPARERFVQVEMPCVVRSDDGDGGSVARAVRALGGDPALSRALCTPNGAKMLELRMSPGSHPAFGSTRAGHALLLRVVRSRSTGALRAKVAGYVALSYAFAGIADFQYLPPPRDAAAGDLPQLHLPPPLFTVIDAPRAYGFRSQRTDRAVAASAAMRSCGEVDANVPDAPLAQLLPQLSDADALLLARVRARFDERPVWTTAALLEALLRRENARALGEQSAWSALNSRLRKVLPHVAYYQTDGPWRRSLVRLGFDPREDSSAARWQTIDVRTTTTAASAGGGSSGGAAASSAAPTAPGTSKGHGLVAQPRRPRNSVLSLDDLREVASAGELKAEGEKEEDEQQSVDESIADVSKLRCAPSGLQRIYCLADVHNRWVQEEISRPQFTFVRKFGWFSKSTIMSFTATLKKMVEIFRAGGSVEEAYNTVVIVEEKPRRRKKVVPIGPIMVDVGTSTAELQGQDEGDGTAEVAAKEEDEEDEGANVDEYDDEEEGEADEVEEEEDYQIFGDEYFDGPVPLTGDDDS